MFEHMSTKQSFHYVPPYLTAITFLDLVRLQYASQSRKQN